MYRVFLERAAEKQLKQLSAKLHDRVLAEVQALAKNPRPPGCRKLPDRVHQRHAGGHRGLTKARL